MSLSNQLAETVQQSINKIPADALQTMLGATQALASSGIVDAAPKQGDQLVAFNLPNQNGKLQSLSALLAEGPLAVTFYRGGWCPYCNLELRAYQSILSDIKAAGANLVAITPELPDSSMTTTEKNELDFQVLSDQGSDYARELGLVFTLPEEIQSLYANFGLDVQKHNGDKQFDLPLAATFVVAQGGSIAGAFVDADYTKRMEPAEVLSILKSLQA